MPDLKTELSKVLDEWSKPETTMTHTAPKPYFTTTNNVCRATFDCIKSNPGKTRVELATMLETKGFKKSSTTSLIGQMLRQGMVRDTGGLLFTIVSEYAPLKSSKVWAKQNAKPTKAKPTKAAPVPELLKVSTTWDADVTLNNLSIVQARALYDALRKIFGG